MTKLYEILGVAPGASTDAIKKAYRKLAKTHHPDGGKTDDGMFDAITKAYNVLSDPERRKRYDETGEIDESADNEQARVLNFIANILLQVVQAAEDPATFDVIAKTREIVQESIIKMNQDLRHGVTEKARIGKVLKRIKGGTGFVEKQIEASLANIDKECANIERMKAVATHGLEMLKGYSYDIDKVAASMQQIPASMREQLQNAARFRGRW